MSDSNYINTYVNLAVETVHNYLNDILQLKTQLSLTNSLVSEKDQAIAALTQEIQSLKNDNQKHAEDASEMQKLRDSVTSWETQYNAMANKASHMDTLVAQYNELKSQFIELKKEKNTSEAKVNECQSLISKYEQEVELFKTELNLTKSKLSKFEKKEEKKSSTVSEKKNINKEETKSTFISTHIEKLKETDDDF